MASSSTKISKYGLDWDSRYPPLMIEREMIRKGGNSEYLFRHYMELRKIVWPQRYRHEWTDLIYREILQNQMTFFMGAASTQKTSHISEFALLTYWCFPENCCVLVSTTTKDKLEQSIFAEIKKLWSAGRKLHPYLAGNLIDYKHCIATDDIENMDDDDVRDLRKGIMGKPCYVGQRYVGLGVFAGIKQEHFIFICDELQFMSPTFLDCLPNMLSNNSGGGLKVIGSGNPKHDPEDQLGIACEPQDGWASVENNTATSSWRTKFGTCVNLIGTDSPNFKSPQGQPEPYKNLIGRAFEEDIARIWGKDSPEYEKQVMGRMKLGLASCRVITRQLCREHNVQDEIVWDGLHPVTKIHATDPAYGGGDRCMNGHIEFGRSVNGKIMVRVIPPQEIKINLKLDQKPEIQIAASVKKYLEENDIPPSNSFYDSFGKGTVGFSFGQIFGADAPIPINSGDSCSKRPVFQGLNVEEKGRKRPKRCDEHYSKFITEMWFSVRYLIEAGQIGELTDDIIHEGCMRVYETVSGNRIEVEPKADMKVRLGGKSPDKFDWLALCIEGARQRGLLIDKLGSQVKKSTEKNWLLEQSKSYKSLVKSKQLQRA